MRVRKVGSFYLPALFYGPTTSDGINFGSAAAVDDLESWTSLSVYHNNSNTNANCLISKNSSTVGWDVQNAGSGNMRVAWNRATTDMTFVTLDTPIKQITTWYVVAAWADRIAATAGMAIAQFGRPVVWQRGTLTAGSGTFSSDAAQALRVGQGQGGTRALQGRLALSALFEGVMALRHINEFFRSPFIDADTRLFFIPRHGLDAFIDESGTNANGALIGGSSTVKIQVGIQHARHYRPWHTPLYSKRVTGGASPIALDGVPVSRARVVVASSTAAGTVSADAPAIARQRVTVGATGAAGSVAQDAPALGRGRVAAAAGVAADTVDTAGAIATRARWVVAAVVTLGGVGVDAVPVARDRAVVPITTEAPPDLIPVARDRVVVAADVTLGGVGVDAAPVVRVRYSVGVAAAAGTIDLDAAPLTRDRVAVAGAVAYGAGVFGGAPTARDRAVVALDVTIGGVGVALAPVARDRAVAGQQGAASGTVDAVAVPVERVREVVPVVIGAPIDVDGLPLTRDRVVVAAAVGFVYPFPTIRRLAIVGAPLGLAIVGDPQSLIILDEAGNVAEYAIKRGDADPPLEFQCIGTDGNPADLTGVDSLVVGFRRSGETGFALLKDATIVDPSPSSQLCRVVWDLDDTDTLGVGDIEFEAEAKRAGRPSTFAGRGYGVFEIWQDIVPDDAS